jgi:hypothetical protein
VALLQRDVETGVVSSTVGEIHKNVVIPAEAGFSTAKLVIHFARGQTQKIKVDPRLRGDDETIGWSARYSASQAAFALAASWRNT